MRNIALCCILFFSLQARSQQSIEPYFLQVTINKTTNILFPCSVKSVDRGTRDVLVQKAKGDDQVLQLKAGIQNFAATNVSVITADGKLYSFAVHYAPEPSILNLSFRNDSLFRNQQQFLHRSVRDEEMKFSLESIYILDHVFWFGFSLSNHSLIDYQPEHVKFFLQDRHRAKRTAIQEMEIEPLNRISFDQVAGGRKKSFFIGFSQFTIPADKRLVCQISEQDGQRLLSLRVRHRTLLKARPEIR
jgi:hypothetical protein